MPTTTHAPFVQSWPRTDTEPAELSVECTCGRFEFSSMESISGGIEPWGDSWAEHLEEAGQ